MNIEKRQELAAALDAIAHQLREPEAPSSGEAVERDAARYRWLRSASVQSGIVLPERWWELLGDVLDEEFDKMIDQAIADNEHTALYSRSNSES